MESILEKRTLQIRYKGMSKVLQLFRSFFLGGTKEGEWRPELKCFAKTNDLHIAKKKNGTSTFTERISYTFERNFVFRFRKSFYFFFGRFSNFNSRRELENRRKRIILNFFFSSNIGVHTG